MTAPCPSFGFIVNVAASSTDRLSALVDELVEVLEANGLDTTMRRRTNEDCDVVVRRDGSQTTDQDRAVAMEWWARRGPGGHLVVGPLVDLAADS